jgi:hypothetical protein
VCAVTPSNSTLAENTASASDFASGGAIFNFGTLTISNSTLTQNTAVFGGGIFNEGLVTLTRVTFQNNTPDDCNGCPSL